MNTKTFAAPELPPEYFFRVVRWSRHRPQIAMRVSLRKWVFKPLRISRETDYWYTYATPGDILLNMNRLKREMITDVATKASLEGDYPPRRII